MSWQMKEVGANITNLDASVALVVLIVRELKQRCFRSVNVLN